MGADAEIPNLGPTSQLSKGFVRDTVQKIGKRIVGGEFPAGRILPTETELAAEYGIGRSTLREAAKILSGKGLLRTARRRGTRVCSRDEWNFLDPDVLGWYAGIPANVPDLLFAINELRAAIEPPAAALAALRSTDQEAENLKRLAEGLLKTASADPFEFDIAFHAGVFRATHNVLFAGFSRSLEILLRTQFSAARPFLRGEGIHPDDRHVALADAIAARDGAKASRLAEGMMRTSRSHYELIARKLGRPAPARTMRRSARAAARPKLSFAIASAR